MAVWKAYVDFSGTDPQSTFISVGVAIATANTWNKILPRWYDVLKKYELTEYHASDFNNYAGQYSGLTKETQLSCHKELIELLAVVNLQYVIHTIRRSEFEIALGRFPQVKRFEPYDYMLEIGVFEIKYWGEKKRADADIGIIIETGEKHNSDVFHLLLRMCEHGELGKISHIEMMEKKKCFSFQIADLLAYEGYRAVMNKVTKPVRPERGSFAAIKSGNPWKHYSHNYITARDWIEKTHLWLVNNPQLHKSVRRGGPSIYGGSLPGAPLLAVGFREQF